MTGNGSTFGDAVGQEVVLVRHGETAWSRCGRHTGRTDLPLTDDGVRRAQRLRSMLADRRFVAVFASPLRRARDTCALAGYGHESRVVDDLREWDYGAYEGRTSADIRKDVPGWALWTHACPGGETAENVGRRADRVLAEIRGAAGDIAVFGHGQMLRVLAARWCGLAPVAGRFLALAGPASVSVLGFDHENAVIRQWNEPWRVGCDNAPGFAAPAARSADLSGVLTNATKADARPAERDDLVAGRCEMIEAR